MIDPSPHSTLRLGLVLIAVGLFAACGPSTPGAHDDEHGHDHDEPGGHAHDDQPHGDDHGDHPHGDDHGDHPHGDDHGDHPHGDHPHDDHGDHPHDALGEHGHDDPGNEAEIEVSRERQWSIDFQISEAVRQPVRPSIRVFAKLATPSDAEVVVSAPRSGRLGPGTANAPALTIGRTVTAGESLFSLGVVPAEAADLASLDLAVSQAGIAAAAARREVERLKPLVAQGVVAQRRLDVALSTLASASVAAGAARRRRQSLGQRQGLTNPDETLAIPSPIAGTLTELLVPTGAYVQAGQPIARVVNRDQLWLDIAVPETYLAGLGEVSGAWFRLDRTDTMVNVGRDALVAIGTGVDPVSRTLSVRFAVDNSANSLFAGMAPDTWLINDVPHDAVTVPYSAVIDDGGVDVVYVQVEPDHFVRRPVRLGIRDGANIEVLEGVRAGESVVSRGGFAVKLAASGTQEISHGHAH